MEKPHYGFLSQTPDGPYIFASTSDAHAADLRRFEIAMTVGRAYMMQRLETKGKLRCELEGYDYDPRKNL